MEARQRLQKVRRVPKWLIVLNKVYHQYGLKHLLLITILIIYQFIGAGIFYLCEVQFDEERELQWKNDVQKNRTEFIQRIMEILLNNTISYSVANNRSVDVCFPFKMGGFFFFFFLK